MPKVWPVEFKLLNGWSLQLFSWSIDISICAIQKNKGEIAWASNGWK